MRHIEPGAGRASARLECARTAVVGDLVYLFNVRYFTQHALSLKLSIGKLIAFRSTALLVVLQKLITYAPPMQQLFGTAPLGVASWSVILGLALAKFLAVEAEKWVLRRFGVKRM